MRAALAAVVVWILAAAPKLALACAVCTAGRDEENQTAFLVSTIFLSLLPLAGLGTLVFVLWRRFQKLEALVEDERLASTPSASATAAAPVAISPPSPVG